MNVAPPLRLLLDQNFPNPPTGLSWETLDQSVRLHHFSHMFPEHAQRSTPDWMVYLLARAKNLDAVVTSDKSQLTQDEELIALDRTAMSLVTWKSGDEDPVVLYGQLLAFMPQIVRALHQRQRTVVSLPNPRLRPSEHIETVRNIIGRRGALDRISYSERRSAALSLMHAELQRRGVSELAEHLGS